MKQNNNLVTILLTIILLLLIIIGYFLINSKNSDKKPIPLGNVDIFEINCNNTCKTDEVFKDDNLFKEDIEIIDNYVNWESNNKLRIFENPVYNMEEIIAPESTNYYQFVIRNNTGYHVNYELTFTEINEYKINMKYRLLKNSKYIIGDEKEWVTYDQLKLKNIKLSSKNNDTYYLEWKWFSSDNDNKIGESNNANYSLNINLKAVEINE